MADSGEVAAASPGKVVCQQFSLDDDDSADSDGDEVIASAGPVGSKGSPGAARDPDLQPLEQQRPDEPAVGGAGVAGDPFLQEDAVGGAGAGDALASASAASEPQDLGAERAVQQQSVEGYATFLAQFYTVFKPDNLNQIPAILKQYAGREEQLYEDIHKKYKPNYDALIRKIYGARNPEKVAQVPELLKKHRGKEFSLFLAICTKYKVTNPNRLVVALNNAEAQAPQGFAAGAAATGAAGTRPGSAPQAAAPEAQRDMARLRAELSSRDARVAALMAEMKELDDQVGRLQETAGVTVQNSERDAEEACHLQMELGKSHKLAAEERQAAEAARKEVDELRTELSVATSATTARSAPDVDIASQRAEEAATLERLREESCNFAAERRSLTQELDDLRSELAAEVVRSRESIDDRAAEAKEEVERERQAEAAAASERDATQQLVEALRSELSAQTAGGDLEASASEALELREACAAVEEERDAAQQRGDALAAEMSEEVAGASAIAQRSAEEAQSLREACEAAKQQLEAAEQQREAAEQQREAAQRQAELFSTEAASVAGATSEQLAEELREQRELAATAAGQRGAAEERVEQLVQELAEQSSRRAEPSSSEVEELTEALEEQRRAEEKAREDRDAALQSVEALRAEMAQQADALASGAGDAERADRLAAELEEERRTAADSTRSLRSQVDVMESEIAEGKTLAAGLESEVVASRAEAAAALSERTDALQQGTCVEDLQDRLLALQSELEEKGAALEAAVAQRDDIQGRNAGLLSELEASKLCVEEAEREAAEIRHRSAPMDATTDDEQAASRAEIVELKSEVASLREALSARQPQPAGVASQSDDDDLML